MAIEEVTNISTQIITGLATEIGKIGLWIQTIGLVIILWLVFQIIILINNRIRRKKMYSIEERLEKIEKKIDKLIKNKK